MGKRRYLNTAEGRLINVLCNDEGQPLIPVTADCIPLPVETFPETQTAEDGLKKVVLVTDYRFPGSAMKWVKEDCGFGGPREPRLLGNCMKCDAKVRDIDPYDMYGRSRPVQTIDGHPIICKKCIPDFTNCRGCGHLYLPNDLVMGNCSACINRAPKNLIKNYTFKVECDFGLLHGDKAPLDELYYGVELELESANYGFDTLLIDTLTHPFARLKKDASIEQGFEIVSAPISIDLHYSLWDDFFKNLPETIQPLRSCGMHVHVSRVRMSNLQIGKMLIFLHNPANRNFIRWIAGRPSSFHNNYETPKKIGDGLNGGILPQNQDRHTALNLNGGNTIEFRIFRATKSRSLFLKNLEFCRALIKFTDWGAHSVSEAADHKVFFNYVVKRRKEYPYLSVYLKEKVAPVLKIT